MRQIVHDYQSLHSEANDIEASMITYREECIRLRHENEFMLKLVDKYMQDHTS
jgi:hypothetical protein